MTPLRILVGLRLAIGTGAWAAPALTAKLFGLNPVANPQATYVARLFAIRNVALGAAGLKAGPGQKQALQAGVVCDLFDAAASLLAKRSGVLGTLPAGMTGATALSATGLGICALRQA